MMMKNVCMSVIHSCAALCDPMDCSPPGSSVHGILQARILEWVAISFSRGSLWSRDCIQVSHIVGSFFTIWASRKVQRKNMGPWEKCDKRIWQKQFLEMRLTLILEGSLGVVRWRDRERSLGRGKTCRKTGGDGDLRKTSNGWNR